MLGSCSGRPSGASWVASTALERSTARRSATSARSSARRALVGALGVAGLGDALGGPFGGFVSSAFCPGGVFGRDRGRCLRAWERASRACCAAVSALRKALCADEPVERAWTRARPLRTHVQRRGGRRAPCSHEVLVVEVPDRGPARSCSSSGCQGGRTRRLHGAQVIQRGGAWLRHWRLVGTG